MNLVSTEHGFRISVGVVSQLQWFKLRWMYWVLCNHEIDFFILLNPLKFIRFPVTN